MPEEIRFFIRTGGFGVTLATIYWFVSYEATGSILLLAFGGAGAFLAVVLAAGARARGRQLTMQVWRWIGFDPQDGPPIAAEPQRYPNATPTPLIGGLGIAVAALGLVYGPPFVVAAAPLLIVGARRWIAEAGREWAAVERSDPG